MKDYAAQKEKIIISNKNGYNIICIDDKNTYEIYKKNTNDSNSNFKTTILKTVYILMMDYIIDNYFENKLDISLKHLSFSLFGDFNIENILASYVVSRILNINMANFTKVLKISKVYLID